MTPKEFFSLSEAYLKLEGKENNVEKEIVLDKLPPGMDFL